MPAKNVSLDSRVQAMVIVPLIKNVKQVFIVQKRANLQEKLNVQTVTFVLQDKEKVT